MDELAFGARCGVADGVPPLNLADVCLKRFYVCAFESRSGLFVVCTLLVSWFGCACERCMLAPLAPVCVAPCGLSALMATGLVGGAPHS